MQGHLRRRVRGAHEVCGRQEVIGERRRRRSGREEAEEVEGADAHHPPATSETAEAQGL